ncbi:unnamed protein product [Candidula unifasciata]|uniref:Proline-rich transmembrane protein 3/4 domain-containing protein n=1 Tax=Candidula unifasciata TaxID=100452 RepID=A0A8S3Z4T9_9EUPU|nr:unnamed protein product [Candidula unifasciata]
MGECQETNQITVNNSCDKNTEPLLVCISPEQPEQSSWRENGYLADTENIFSCSTFSRLSSPFHRKRKSHDQFDPVACDVSHKRSSSSLSDDCSKASPVFQERIKPATSASLGLFRIRQSRVVQRAVHLTYLLTFLFMFASLLQLYTVFGVYGVLGTNPRPDPWPWLLLHTIFRATEVSIGFSIAAIAFITLNYRHQRAKRRQQQQQHLVATRDCIV